MKVLSTVGAMTACASCVSAFVTPSSISRVMTNSPLRMSEPAAATEDVEEAPPAPPAPVKPAMSESIPFLLKPKNLDGMVGDIGFDPLGFATMFPIKFLREAELKNGRVAMLAVVGWLVSELVHVPGAAYQSENPVDAMAAVGPGPMLQIFLFCGFLEWKFHNVSAVLLSACCCLIRMFCMLLFLECRQAHNRRHVFFGGAEVVMFLCERETATLLSITIFLSRLQPLLVVVTFRAPVATSRTKQARTIWRFASVCQQQQRHLPASIIATR